MREAHKAEPMPIDYQQIYTKIQEVGKGLRERRQTLEKRRAEVWELISYYDLKLDWLRLQVNSAKQADSNVRCAYPVDEPLLSAYPQPASVTQATLIAA